ncbi:hypothetical protein F1936_12880, partial [Akkermansia sp. BIOML-A3]
MTRQYPIRIARSGLLLNAVLIAFLVTVTGTRAWFFLGGRFAGGRRQGTGAGAGAGTGTGTGTGTGAGTGART